MPAQRWQTRSAPPALADQWRRTGHWDGETLGEKIDRGLRDHPDQVFRIHSLERPWAGTYADLQAETLRVAGGLAALGIGPDDVIAFQLPNWVEAAVTFYAASLLGAVVVPIVHFYGPREVSYILGRSEATVFITAASFGRRTYLADLPAIIAGAPSLQAVAVVGADDASRPAGTIAFESLYASPSPRKPAQVDPDAPAVIAYTSGTTSDPKGVIHTHHTLGAEVRQLGSMTPDDGTSTLIGTPLGHFMGMLGGLLIPLTKGDPIHVIDVWDPARVLKVIAEYRLSAGSGSTYFLTSLLDHPDWTDDHLQLIRRVGLGGAAAPPAVTRRAEALGIAVVRMYGSTEHPSITGSRHVDEQSARLDTDGRPMAGVEIKLLDDDGQPVPVGEPGEIWSRGPDLFVGYTDAALTASFFDAEGFYRTEDLGVLDAAGCLTITDRKKDIIIRGGENISAAEVEELLLQVLPDALEVAVIAVPDDRFGERVGAVLRLAEGAPTPSVAAVRQLLLEAGLGRQKAPEVLETVQDFPRTSTGKIMKVELRRQARARHGV